MNVDMHQWVQTISPYFFFAGNKHVVYHCKISQMVWQLCGDIQALPATPQCFGCLCQKNKYNVYVEGINISVTHPQMIFIEQPIDTK
jgi:hypothetical protein